ncbi:F-box-like/WD repeat-containing protein TBL1X [Dysidea avara]|uniref:F-box-like/WD repeat-containing protein TBL1X n=1 Tax=Dysidea avara TaxID=196820 RepID=UPI003317D4EC
MSFTSDEVNFIVYRYLLESGFHHSAFTFGQESHVHQCSINGTLIPPGALIGIIQKGLQYVEVETSITEDGKVLDEKQIQPLSLVDALAQDCMFRSPLAKDVAEDQQPATLVEPIKTKDGTTKAEDTAEAMEVDRHVVAKNSLLITSDRVTTLKGHQSEVFTCAWCPSDDLIASGSSDSTARLWKLDGSPVIVLPHENNTNTPDSNRDVTTVCWNGDGSLLATGSYDGAARIWDKEGHLQKTLTKHQGPVFALKWNKKGNYLLSGGVDKTTVVWDVQLGEVKQHFALHADPVIDVDWQNSNCFASCSTDKNIHVCKLGSEKPIQTFTGHQSVVNVVKWDPSCTLLASCSDDHTAKIWSMKQSQCVHDLSEHTADIYTIQWSSANSTTPLLLATASHDTTVRLWEPERGTCLQTLRKHEDPVYSVAFSPDGKLLASGSFDTYLCIWSVQDGSLLHHYKGTSGIFEVCWNEAGNKLAASFQDSSVCVLDLRNLSSIT